jgi:hypothetical protein
LNIINSGSIAIGMQSPNDSVPWPCIVDVAIDELDASFGQSLRFGGNTTPCRDRALSSICNSGRGNKA